MFSKTIKAALIASAIMMPAATAALAYPNTRHEAQIENQINAVVLAARNQGFRLIVANQRSHMTPNGRVSFTVYLTAGNVYKFAARCYTDCTDLDLVLRDADGRELRADRDLDDYPGFNFRAPYTGAYIVTLEMANCRASRCQVGAVVMA